MLCYSVSGKDPLGEKDALLVGMVARNRAVHGDSVVIELLPRKQWQGRSKALKENQQEGKLTEVSHLKGNFS